MRRLFVAALLCAAPAWAADVTGETMRIERPFALETPPAAKAGAGYLAITNTGTATDRLLEIRADFPRVMLHNTETDAQGVSRMIHIDVLDIPAGETVTLAPGGMHVMFMGLAGDPFEVGETIPAVLVFEQAGEVAVDFVVEPRNSASGGAGHN